LAGAYFRDRSWEDGQLHYGLVVVERATCKKGKIQVVLHQSQVIEPGRAWLADLDIAAATEKWSFTLQTDCKGTASETTVRTSAQPLLDGADIAGFYAAILGEVAANGAPRITERGEESIVF
jgi:hypothetical protein